MQTHSVGFVLAMLLAGCAGGAPAKTTGYPPQPEGCAVQVFPESPPMPTENIGPVMASCGPDIADADCLRTLKDQACKLGADVIWGVPDKSSMEAGKKRFYGRAAHTKTATAKP